MKKTWPLWLLALIITISAACYQRMTGPTHPKSESIKIQGEELRIYLPRSAKTPVTPEQAKGHWETMGIQVPLNLNFDSPAAQFPEGSQAYVHYRRSQSHAPWQRVEATPADPSAAAAPHHGKHLSGPRLTAQVPAQPPAGKLVYYIEIVANGVSQFVSKEEPVSIRFRNNVPAWALIPHILFMFAAMLLSSFCGLLALRKDSRCKKYTWLTITTLFIGGFLFGPLIQYYAFGIWWSGWPLGSDLTDNKTLIALIVWIIALLFMNKKSRYILAIIAAIALLAIFSIPHSTSGSEFNYQSGKVETETAMTTEQQN